ncbi:MAG: hypothetical protein Q9160_005815, partial [Pyrenula sp. 1 TL-2023]
MDPVTILSVVTSVVSLVDAASKAATTCYEIYKHGASTEHLQLEFTSTKLQKGCSELNDILSKCSEAPCLQSNIDLKDFTKKCCSIARDLREILEALRAESGKSHEIVSKFLKSKRKAGEIEKLKRKLDEHQKTLGTLLAIDVRRVVTELASRQAQDSAKLNHALKSLEASLCSSGVVFADDIQKAIENATELQNQQAEITRERITRHFENTVQTLAIHQGRDQQFQQFQREKDLFLESLRFEDINIRSNEISETSPKTFEWIFDTTEDANPWDNFSRWLQDGKTIYWVSGKAGSGKSTLMKFIANDLRT